MPQLRILQPEEVAKLVGSNDKSDARAQIQAEFDQLIADVSPDQYATVALVMMRTKRRLATA